MSAKVLITGGSSGIGEALVRLLSQGGYKVLFTFCRGEKNAKEIAQATNSETVRYDQNSEESIADLSQRIDSGDFDAFVSNASELSPRQLFVKTDADDFLRYFERGIRGAFVLNQAFAANLKKRKAPGTIVHVLSSYILGLPPEKLGAYITLKSALLGLARSQAVELIKHNIRVNAVSPGMTRTPFISDLPERFIQTIEETLPMGRIASPQEVASVIKFLVSADSNYVNGANIPVTGGQIC